MYYNLIGSILTVVIGWVVSCITASEDDAYDSKLLHPFIYKMSLWCPGTPRNYAMPAETAVAKIIDDMPHIPKQSQDNTGFEMRKDE